MTPPVSYAVPGERTSPEWCEAFATGCGGRVVPVRDAEIQALKDGPVAMFGSWALWPLLRQAQRESRTWYYGDHGYFGRHEGYYRITRNDYQHDGRGKGDLARFKRFNRPIQPWRKGGRHVVICPNSATYFGLFGLDLEVWLRGVKDALRAATDRPVRWRMKGDQRRTLSEDLVGAWAVVVFSSAAAIDALIVGVPVFVLAPFAAGYRMGRPELSQIEWPYYPEDREAFCAALASNQWTLAEMRRGDAWNTLRRTS